MSVRNLCDPEDGLRPGEQWIVDGLDWSWAFVWFQEVPDCPGYWLGSNGSLWSFRDNSGKVKAKCRRMSPGSMPTGHLKIHLTDKNKKRRMFYIHSLVNILFNSPRPDGMVCRHRDGNPTNNRYWNLEWGTQLDNIRDRDRVHKTTARGIDGCLNHFSWYAGGHIGPWARPDCVAHLDRIVFEANCDIVLTSTWRGLINDGLMTPRGFGALMMTHGMKECHRFVGATAAGRLSYRGQQVREWWRANPQYDRLVALDDMDLGYDNWGIKWVQTDGRVGLTAADADRAITLLRGEVVP